ncbi:hypothetical protein L836_4779 [Mycobacteroides abscessus MAB_110811_2726]|nr:hypothetical protein L836_4779 [Mycobacteroides abscessus MAB_110811_2726]
MALPLWAIRLAACGTAQFALALQLRAQSLPGRLPDPAEEVEPVSGSAW